jgi:two-component system response regulator FixJ
MTPEQLVHVIDDDDPVRDSIVFLVQSFGFEVRAYNSAVAFLAEIGPAPVGCVVTDVRMPNLSGLDLLSRMRELFITLPVIVITGHGDIPLAVQAMKQGAVDFIEKPFEEQRLVDAVRQALAATTSQSARDESVAVAKAKVAALSPRERQTLEGLVKGQPNKIIAHELGISPRTVEVHRAHLMEKMGADSLPEMVRLALMAGIETDTLR